MTIEHSAIADADRHEAKGASTASDGQVLKADGDGTTSFVTPTSLTNISFTEVLNSMSTITQSPTTVDTVMDVSFGSATSNSDVSLSSGGTVTFDSAGFYYVTLQFTFGRATGAGVAKMVARLLVNDTAIDPYIYIALAENETAITKEFSFFRAFSETNTLAVELIRDSDGIDEGSLVVIDPVLAGWSSTGSAAIRIQKIAGAS